ncbi:MAG: J domain-containing protein [Deltaproteobacteria bacterium]|jgi:molecular chaperone DnaJ|nr:J domain-containing protein [Deltaproteobacteria bacterium]
MLSRAECFKVLGLDESAGPNAIKKAYRKLAFELHPDLNPGLPEAAKKFQLLNEAYVILIQEYSNTSFASDRRRAGARSGPGASRESARWDEKTRAEARRAYEKARTEANQRAAEASAQSSQDAKATFDPAAAKGAGPAGAFQSGSPVGPSSGPTAGGAQGQPGGAYVGRAPGREEILRDLLNDPFARRVFEDIYSHVRYTAGKGGKASPPPPPRKKAPVRVKAQPRKSAISAVGDGVSRLAGGIRGWLRKQIDDEQTMYLPGESLLPGARVRLQVRHGFSGDKKTIEFTLPPEFLPGKPIRLKGLGRRLGNVQGDLYLRILIAAREQKDH